MGHGLASTPSYSSQISVPQVSYSELNIDNVMVAEQRLITQRSSATIKGHRKDVLQAMCLARHLSIGGTKQDLVMALLKWVRFFCLSL